jgi:hypothetical protein
MYFIHNIFCILFTIYYVFHSNIVNEIRHKRCSAFAPFHIFRTTVSVLVITCLAVPQLLAYTRKQTDRRENLIAAVFQIFFSSLL